LPASEALRGPPPNPPGSCRRLDCERDRTRLRLRSISIKGGKCDAGDNDNPAGPDDERTNALRVHGVVDRLPAEIESDM